MAERSQKYKPKFPAVTLTPEQLALQAQLKAQKEVIDAAEEEYQRLRGTCMKHLLLPPMTDELRDGLRKGSPWTWKYDYASCDVCKQSFGYRCPGKDSPDEVCHYFTEDQDGKNMVLLSNGEYVEYTDPEHSPDHESDDYCLYCGSPQERK